MIWSFRRQFHDRNLGVFAVLGSVPRTSSPCFHVRFAPFFRSSPIKFPSCKTLAEHGRLPFSHATSATQRQTNQSIQITATPRNRITATMDQQPPPLPPAGYAPPPHPHAAAMAPFPGEAEAPWEAYHTGAEAPTVSWFFLGCVVFVMCSFGFVEC